MSITFLIQAENVFAQNLSVTRKINDKSISTNTNTNNALQNNKRNESNVPKDTDLKNYKLVLKIFIRGSSTESKEEHPCHWRFINKKRQ